MKKIIDIDTDNLILTVESGVTKENSPNISIKEFIFSCEYCPK